MKRDLDLIRDLLIQVESTSDESGSDSSPWRTFSATGASATTVTYHARLLLERGFLHSDAVKLDGADDAGNPAAKFRADALTHDGHEFLEAVRDPMIWTKTKDGAAKAGSFGIDLIKKLAIGFLKKQIEQRTGVKMGD